ncbi:MAG: aromatic amino acid transport family protein [Simkaniaceae bacterium]|nr:aromatic amino acid transport family protein [Candidatus Sacchlamyda saccharinae]
MPKKIATLNASFLVAGTSIGAGMLGLPVETSGGGFFPAIVFLLVNWIVLTGTALLFVEVLDKNRKNTNFISLSEKLLGKEFKIITFIVYVTLFASLTLAYVKGGGVFISDIFDKIPVSLGCLIFLLIFSPLIILGSKYLGIGNSVLTTIMIIFFIVLISYGITSINTEFLTHINWKFASLSIPMFITSFGFHSILPSLHSYLGNKKSLKCAVIIGTTITFSIYLVWELVVLGTIPLNGEHSLSAALLADQTAISPLKYHLNSPLLSVSAQIFYFTALTTSFLGIGLGLIDFLLDSFSISQKILNRLFLGILIYLPAIWIAQTNLRIFYISIKYGGGFACFYLLILLPILLFIRSNKPSKNFT